MYELLIGFESALRSTRFTVINHSSALIDGRTKVMQKVKQREKGLVQLLGLFIRKGITHKNNTSKISNNREFNHQSFWRTCLGICIYFDKLTHVRFQKLFRDCESLFLNDRKWDVLRI